MQQKQKQDEVDFGNDREDNIIEDLNTLSAIYDKIEPNVNSLRQWVSILAYVLGTLIFYVKYVLVFLT